MEISTINKYLVYLLLVFFSTSNLYSNEHLADSLRQTWNDETIEDSTRLKALDRLIWEEYLFNKPDSAFILSEIQRELAQKKGLRKIESWALNNQGVSYVIRGDYVNGMTYYKESLVIREEIGDKRAIAITLNNIGLVYERVGDLNNALDYHQRSLKIKEELENEKGIAMSLGNIGSIYLDKEEVLTARKYFLDALNIFLKKEIWGQVVVTNINIGKTYLEESKIDSCELFLDKSNDIYEAEKTNAGKASYYNLRTKVFIYKNQNDQARKFAELGLIESEKTQDVTDLENALSNLYKLNKGKNDTKALNFLERRIKIADSIKNKEVTQQVIRQELQYEFDKKSFEDSVKAVEKRRVFETKVALKDEQIKRSNTLKVALFTGIAVLIIFGFIIYRRYKFSEQQNDIINRQKNIVEQHNAKITDSINYAKRLQDATLPSKTKLDKIFSNYFVFFKPKDIVAGDFYFADVVKEKNNKLIYYVAADCTGHGVPGAMVSIVGANGLKRCIQEFKLRKPGEILNKLSELVAENFAQSEEKIRDGMDLAICCLEEEDGKPTKLHYAGANNPLWVINPSREKIPETGNSFKEGGGFEIKADKQAIGYTENIKPFTTHTFEVEKGDTVYTFSDGYPDQFGGEKGKKLKSANFRKMLFEIQDKSMDEQLTIIDKRFEEWKRGREQVDDVCVIGVKV